MQFNVSQADPLYFVYNDSGPCLGLVLPALLINVVSMAGVLMNATVVLTTAFTKSLHGTANYLLALMSFFEMLHQSGHLIFLIVALTGLNFIRVWTALILQMPMLFGLNATLLGMPLAAADRLFALLAPAKHANLNKSIYLGTITLVCMCYGLYFDYYMFTTVAMQIPNGPISGYISDTMAHDSENMFFHNTAIFMASSAGCYVLIGLIISKKSGVTAETNKRLLKSLLLIILVNIGGYLISLSFYQLIFALMAAMDYVTVWQISFVPGIALNLGAACNAPILYFTSSEYKRAFLTMLSKLRGHQFGANNRVFHVTTTQQPHQKRAMATVTNWQATNCSNRMATIPV